MEELDYESKNKNNIDENNINKEIFENKDISNSDPIPPLLNPIKEKNNDISPINEIISNLKKNNQNLNQIQILAKNKISIFILNQNLQKYNSTPEQKNLMLINDLIESRETHFISTFKDYLIIDYQEEFLRRYFFQSEITEVLPKFYQYYKNYLNFFCKGTFCDFDVNSIMQEYGECQAEFYYNKNYGHKDKVKKKDKKENLNKNNQNEDNNNENNNNENGDNLDLIKLIFTKSIENSIEKVKNSYNLEQNENKEELSNIKPYYSNKENTIILPDNSTVTSNDIITKENSIKYIINLMNKKNQRINLNKKIKNKKREMIPRNNNNDKNKKININNNKNSENKKYIHILSKTTSNLNVKNQKKNNSIKTRNKSNSIKINCFFKNNVLKPKNIQNISSYKKFIEILTSRPKNKSTEPKKKVFPDEFVSSSHKSNKNNKNNNRTKNIISSINQNDIISHNNLISNNNLNNNAYKSKNNYNSNKVNSSLFILNNIQNIDKNNKNIYNYNTLFPLSISKINNINKNRYNIGKKSEGKEGRKLKVKDNDGKNLYIKSFLKALKNVSSTPKAMQSNNNYNSNKSLSYSTVNNCNININNNIILSNNYYSNKNHHLNQLQINTTSKKILDKALQQKKSNINNNIIKPLPSRNNQNDLNRFKTESNMVNSNNPNKNIVNINQYKSFRKSYNNEMLIKQKNFEKKKKYRNSSSHNKNFSLKNIPVTVKNNNLNNYINYSSNRVGKLFDEFELHSINKTYKNLISKKNKNKSQQKKIIFDYKRK